jgi:type VI protein secretion system component VasK
VSLSPLLDPRQISCYKRLDSEPTRNDVLETNAIRTCSGLVRTRRSIFVRQLTCAGLFLSLLLVGCAVVLVSSYDEVTDQQIQDAAKQTEALIGDVLVNRTSYNQHAKDYQEIDGALGALEMRAVNYQNNEAEVDLIQKLRLALRNLRRIHKEFGPF